MSLSSRLSSLIRSAAGNPAVRRAAGSLTRSALHEVERRRRSASTSERDPRLARGDHSGRSDAPDREPPGRGQRSASGGGASTAVADEPRALHDRASLPPVQISYAPRRDGDADPGEVAWSWVAYEEDITRGKDRPVLVLARELDADGDVLIALMLTSRDRVDGVRTDEHGATWVDIGTGAWDGQGRPSEVRADRLLRLPAGSVRREGARLDAERFGEVADVVRRIHGWA